MEMDTLTAPLLKELIDRIEVSEVQGKGKNRTQRIVIHYRFAGYIDLERDYLESNIVQDILAPRQHPYSSQSGTAMLLRNLLFAVIGELASV